MLDVLPNQQFNHRTFALASHDIEWGANKIAIRQVIVENVKRTTECTDYYKLREFYGGDLP